MQFWGPLIDPQAHAHPAVVGLSSGLVVGIPDPAGKEGIEQRVPVHRGIQLAGQQRLPVKLHRATTKDAAIVQTGFHRIGAGARVGGKDADLDTAMLFRHRQSIILPEKPAIVTSPRDRSVG